MIKILYIHGYHGNPYGGSFQKLSKYAQQADFGAEKVEMHSIDYDESDPNRSIRKIRLYYYEHDIDLIIGSSLGGFLAASCRWARRIAVNPCWSPSVELPEIGYTGSVKDYQFKEKHIGDFAKFGDDKLCIGCFSPEDEILGLKYREAFSEKFPQTYEIPGGHHLSEEAAEVIMTQIVPKLIADFKASEGPGHIVSGGLSEFERLHHAHMLSIYNVHDAKDSEMCGCFYCGKVFPASEITETIFEFDNPETVLCPYCMIDSVLPDATWKDLSPEFLDKMYEHFF
jgi:predicted esterase YcpF (UPF0227 family)